MASASAQAAALSAEQAKGEKPSSCRVGFLLEKDAGGRSGARNVAAFAEKCGCAVPYSHLRRVLALRESRRPNYSGYYGFSPLSNFLSSSLCFRLGPPAVLRCLHGTLSGDVSDVQWFWPR